jgi:hypothetical protein
MFSERDYARFKHCFQHGARLGVAFVVGLMADHPPVKFLLFVIDFALWFFSWARAPFWKNLFAFPLVGGGEYPGFALYFIFPRTVGSDKRFQMGKQISEKVSMNESLFQVGCILLLTMQCGKPDK